MQEDETDVSLTPRRLIGWEIFVVFAVSLGASGVRALVELIGSLTAPQALSTQQALLVGTLAPGRPWLDLALQLVSLAQGLAPVALVGGVSPRSRTPKCAGGSSSWSRRSPGLGEGGCFNRAALRRLVRS